MMKKYIPNLFFSVLSLITFYTLSISPASGQKPQYATWKFQYTQQDYNIGDEIEIIFSAKIEKGWYLYSNDFDPELGPTVTAFSFDKNITYELIDSVYPINPQKKYDDIWGGEYTYFKERAEFRQKVKVLAEEINIYGVIDYQVCNDEAGTCIPYSKDFSFSSNTNSINNNVIKNNETNKYPIKTFEKESLNTPDKTSSLLGFMILAFLGGLAALFTPCVFPMIPMTVTYFTGKGSETGGGTLKALVYGLSIIVIGTIFGAILAPFNGPYFANDLSTSATMNIIFFVVFIIFAFSFLGMFEITLPSSLVNKMDKEADKGGYYGVFFMAFTLMLVSFSCTGPIVGSILVESFGGAILKPILGMFSFSMAFAIPFTLFAIFPKWINTLPKSGGWLNSVKVFLGFVELALAFKFLSIADLTHHWGILDREVVIVIWIIIAIFMGFNFLGKIRLPNDAKVDIVTVPRLLLAMSCFTFATYLTPGLFGAPLKALAGYLPDMYTHDFDIHQIIKNNNSSSNPKKNNVIDFQLDSSCENPKYGDIFQFPHGLSGYFDYQEAITCAKEQNKPIFIDFTGHGCVNCRKMEEYVWSDPNVLKRLKNDYVLLALYVDDKTELPESEWYISSSDNKLKKTIGEQNIDFEYQKFNNVAQPYYILLNHNEKPLVQSPMAYDSNPKNFTKYLDEGVKNFKVK